MREAEHHRAGAELNANHVARLGLSGNDATEAPAFGRRLGRSMEQKKRSNDEAPHMRTIARKQEARPWNSRS